MINTALAIISIVITEICSASMVFCICINAAIVAIKGNVRPNERLTKIDMRATSMVVNPYLK